MQVKFIRKAAHLFEVNGLILPGGESTTMLKLLKTLDMEQALRETFARIPCWGICAGAILMARKVEHPEQSSFGAVDVTITRNAYGRQLDSFNVEIAGSEVSFIRAPKISAMGSAVETLASYAHDPVWVREGRHMLSTFHPELGQHFPSTMHQIFVKSLPQI